MAKLLMLAVNGLVTRTYLPSFVITFQQAPPAFANWVLISVTDPSCRKLYDETELRSGGVNTSGKCSVETIITSLWAKAMPKGPASADGWVTAGPAIP